MFNCLNLPKTSLSIRVSGIGATELSKTFGTGSGITGFSIACPGIFGLGIAGSDITAPATADNKATIEINNAFFLLADTNSAPNGLTKWTNYVRISLLISELGSGQTTLSSLASLAMDAPATEGVTK
jgi:hypothetical protein